jgi:imidazole glycerol-phosphate synthase subunit HisH
LKSSRLKKVGIIDYGMGNLWSVKSAFEYIGTSSQIISEPNDLNDYEYLVLPGVGSFNKAIANIKARGLDEGILNAVNNNVKILGICLGMQLLGTKSTEDGETEGLGLIPTNVDRFDKSFGNKIPHIGFNTVIIRDNKGLFSKLDKNTDFYFLHSYKMSNINIDGRIASCNYGEDFIAAIEYGSVCGTQFHPEKSQNNGLQLLKNFLIYI